MSAGSIEGTPDAALAMLATVPSAAESSSPMGLLEQVLQRGVADVEARRTLDSFLGQTDRASALEVWLVAQGLSPAGLSLDRVGRLLSRDIARLDEILARQVNAILHHPRFQQLESSWRGLYFLAQQAQDARERIGSEGGKSQIRIEMLSISKVELVKDFDRASEFDRSQIWRKVYEEEFGMPGGEPFGVLVGDYEFANDPQDVELLGKMAEVAAGSFCPFIAGAAPKLLQLDSFSTLEQPLNLSGTFDQLPYLRWRSLRDRDDARFIGLTLPRVLMRLPYEDDGSRADGFRFREDVEAPDYRNYLWGSSAYAFAAVLIRAFGASRWFADIRGMERDVEAGGVVTGLPVHSFSTDRRGVATKASLEVRVSESQEQELARLGLIPLCHAWDTDYCVFYSNASLNKPKQYDEPAATANARISAMLQYVTCASRFAHYLKVIARNKLGSFQSGEELEKDLNRWLNQYVTVDAKASPTIKARYPLFAGKVEVRDIPGSPGSYRLVMHLLPHFQLDRLTAALRLVTRLTSQPG
ncbi:MAG: type VI secretion system contractile sheath large subunit [Pirellulales bacterium]